MTHAPVAALTVLALGCAADAQTPDTQRSACPQVACNLGTGSKLRFPLLSEVTGRVGVIAARGEHGVTGAGAAVCVIDSGVDLSHRDFRDASGATRVRALYEVETGAVWRAADIDAELAAGGGALPIDELGHGTAVASVAVGDDSDGASAGTNAGVAVEASLIVVDAWRTSGIGFEDDDLIAGARFCADEGATAIVLGLGGHDGRHDGSEPLEAALAEIAQGGVAVVVAAGNDGARAVHAAGWLDDREVATVGLSVPVPVPGERFVALMLENESGSGAGIAIETPDGTLSPVVRPGFTHSFDHAGGRVVLDGTRDASRTVHVVLSGGGEVPVLLGGGQHTLRVHGPGRFHLWLVAADLGDTLLPARLSGPFVDARATVTIPATSPLVIAVGASTVDGEVAPWSARGPTVTGAPKPDLVAPGGPFATALSSDVDPDHRFNVAGGSPARLETLRAPDDRVIVTGSSFAAPLVAGAIALASELDPSADRAALLASARQLTERAWDPQAGAGELDVSAFVTCRAATSPCEERADPEVVLTRDAVAPGSGVWLVARGTGDRLSVRGPAPPAIDLDLSSGVALAPLPVPNARPGDELVYEPTLDGLPLPPLALRVHVDPARDTSPPYARGAGGCAVAPVGSDHPYAAVLAALLALSLRRRRP